MPKQVRRVRTTVVRKVLRNTAVRKVVNSAKVANSAPTVRNPTLLRLHIRAALVQKRTTLLSAQIRALSPHAPVPIRSHDSGNLIRTHDSTHLPHPIRARRRLNRAALKTSVARYRKERLRRIEAKPKTLADRVGVWLGL